jgi:class 3 adenylate cyclase/tetratricopeptide (TPR) repeat protein
VTVLFADLKGSMELLADRDPEEARNLLDPVLKRMMEAVHHYEGTVNQVMGDGIMALFGAPIGHEDHAVRACYAALRMQRRINLYADEVQRAGGTPVQVRVGLNSGEVVVRAIGSDLHMDYTAVGQTTHLAARMEQMAKPGSALVTGDTLKLAEGYVQVRPLGAVPVKGLDTPTQVYELTGSVPARSRLQASAARGLTRFVGRDSELQQLAQALERAAAGHGQAVAVVGEAGVGKSRLVWEFTRSHRTQGWLVLESGSVSYGKATPYLPVIELLKAYCRIQERDDPREIRERVAGKLLMLDRALEPLLTPLLALLDLPVDDAAWDALDPPQRRQRTLDAVKRLLLRESQVQPLLVLFEDLHWIDSETQALLDGLMESLPTARMLLLVNYRPEYEHAWGRKTYYLQLRIDPLPPESAEALLRALLGEDRTLEPLKRVLIERTEGNPFFLEESVRTLVETQVLVGERGAYRMTRVPELWQIPATAQAILAARIDRLAPEDKRLLQTAAVIGKDVPLALLQAIADVPEDTLRRGLTDLQAAEFLYETSLFPDLEYTFKHALTHEVAYGSVLQDRRRALHTSIVGAIEALYPDRLTEHVERLAHHAVRGELWDKAAQYLRQAGAKAVARSATREAIELFEQALAALAHLPETEESLAEALDAHLALGPALIALKGAAAPEVEDCYRRAQELCGRLQETSRLFPAVWGQWYVNYSRGQHQAARERGERLLAVARDRQDPALLLEAHHSLWATLFGMGEPALARPHQEQGLALYDPGQHRAYVSLYGAHDPGACSRYTLAVTLWELGRPDQALAYLQEAERLVQELSHPLTTVISLYYAAWLHHHRGEAEVVVERAETLRQLATAYGFSFWAEQGSILLAHAKATQEPGKGGLEQLWRLVAPKSAIRALRDVFALSLLVDACARERETAKGLGLVSRALPSDEEEIQGFYAPELSRLRGELLLQEGTDASSGAEACFRRAIEIARARQERSFELRAAMSLSRLLDRQGKREEAREMLAEIYRGFDEGFGTRDLQEAKALLERL